MQSLRRFGKGGGKQPFTAWLYLPTIRRRYPAKGRVTDGSENLITRWSNRKFNRCGTKLAEPCLL